MAKTPATPAAKAPKAEPVAEGTPGGRAKIVVLEKYPVTGVIRWLVTKFDATAPEMLAALASLDVECALATCRTQRNHAKNNAEDFPSPTIVGADAQKIEKAYKDAKAKIEADEKAEAEKKEKAVADAKAAKAAEREAKKAEKKAEPAAAVDAKKPTPAPKAAAPKPVPAKK